MINLPIPSLPENQGLFSFLLELLRRSVDGTVKPLFVDSTNQRVGIGTTSPTVPLDVSGAANISGDETLSAALIISGEAAPAVAAAGKAKLYTDSTSKKLRLSLDTGAYSDVVTVASATTVDTTARMLALLGGSV